MLSGSLEERLEISMYRGNVRRGELANWEKQRVPESSVDAVILAMRRGMWRECICRAWSMIAVCRQRAACAMRSGNGRERKESNLHITAYDLSSLSSSLVFKVSGRLAVRSSAS